MLDVQLAKYGTFRDEVIQRVGYQGQAFNYLTVVLGAVVALVAALIESERHGPATMIVFALPIVIAPLAFYFFDNEIMILGVALHILTDHSDQIEQELGAPMRMGARPLAFVHPRTKTAHQWSSYGRWLAFLSPMVGATTYALLKIGDYKSDVEYWLVLGADIVLTGIILFVAAAVWMEHRRPTGWRSQMASPHSSSSQ